jgi:hypothetical protein
VIQRFPAPESLGTPGRAGRAVARARSRAVFCTFCRKEPPFLSHRSKRMPRTVATGKPGELAWSRSPRWATGPGATIRSAGAACCDKGYASHRFPTFLGGALTNWTEKSHGLCCPWRHAHSRRRRGIASRSGLTPAQGSSSRRREIAQDPSSAVTESEVRVVRSPPCQPRQR